MGRVECCGGVVGVSICVVLLQVGGFLDELLMAKLFVGVRCGH